MNTKPSPSSTDEPGIEPIICAGSAFEIGRAQGEALAERLRACRASLHELEAFQLRRPRWLPKSAFLRLAEHRASSTWRRSVVGTDQESAARLEGIAAGARMRPASLQLLNLLEALISDLREQTVLPPIGGCSAMAVSAQRSANGEPMLARNFDYLPLIQPFYFMRDTRPTEGLRSLDLCVAPLVGAVDGMNEAGLCITFNYAFAVDEPQPGSTISMVISKALARCRTVDEANDFLCARPRWGGGLLMLADAAGDVASLELSNSRAEVRRPKGDEGVLFHSNRFQSPRMREVELSGEARYSERAPEVLRGKVVHDSSSARDARFAGLIDETQRFSEDDLTRIMSDHGPEGSPSNESICMHSDYWFTTASLQFFPRSRRVRVAFDTACKARFVELK